jgi:hypothetical protein
MSQWVQNLIPFFILVPIVLLFFGFYFNRVRRGQRENAAALERNWVWLQHNLKAANRQADAMERVAAALEASANAKSPSGG